MAYKKFEHPMMDRAHDPRTTPREAYERGASVTALMRWFHLSNSEVQDVAPEEFGDEDSGRDKVSGY